MACNFKDFSGDYNNDIYTKTGIYLIVNLINNKCYIGSASKTHKNKSKCGFYWRWYTHIYQLKNNNHHNKILQNSFNKYGIENFEFHILEYCDRDQCILQEQKYLTALNPEYNLCKVAGSCLGVKRTKEQIELMRIRSLKENNPEKGKKISIALTGKKRIGYKKISGYHMSREGKISNRDKRRNHKNIHLKLTIDKVKEIKFLFQNGEKGINIAKKYKISPAAVCDIKKERTWSDIKI